MKKIILFLLMAIPALAWSQRYGDDTKYGTTHKRSLTYIVMGMPNDTFPVPLQAQGNPHIAAKTDSIFLWDTASKSWAFYAKATGSTNENIGSGYRLAIPGSNNIKTFFPDLWLVMDSTTNANALTIRADSSGMASYFLRRKDSIVAYVTPTLFRDSVGQLRSRIDSIYWGLVADSVSYKVKYEPTDSLTIWGYVYHFPDYLSVDSAALYTIPLGGGGGTPSLTQYRIAVGDASNQLSDAAAISANRALISDANGVPTHSVTTAAELAFVNGVTSAIQTQLNAKQATITGAATTITSADLTADRALISNGSGKVAVATVTATELNYVSGVTSALQTQINNILDSLDSVNARAYCTIYLASATDVVFVSCDGSKEDTVTLSGAGAAYTFNAPLIESSNVVDLDTSSGKWRSEGYFDTKYAQQNSNWFIINQFSSVQTNARFWVQTFRVDSTALFGSHAHPVNDNAYELGSTAKRWSTVHTGIIRNSSGVGLRLSTTDILKLTSSSNIVIGNSGTDDGTGRDLQVNGPVSLKDSIHAPNIHGSATAADSALGVNRTTGILEMRPLPAGGSSPTVGTYSTRTGLSPSNGDQFFQTDDGRNAPAGLYYYLNSGWSYTNMNHQQFSEFFDDFYNIPSSGQTNGFFFNTNSGGSATAANGNGGVIQLNTGTTSSSRVVLIAGANGSPGWNVIPGSGAIYIRCRITDIPTLGDGGTEDYNLRIGIGNTLSGVWNTGVWIEYSSGTSANWRYATSNGGTSTITTSGTAVTTGGHTLEILINPGATSVEYWVDGTSLGTITTNIPTSTTSGPEIQLQKTAGTTARTVDINYYQMWQRFTSARN